MSEKSGTEEVEERPGIKLLRSWLNKNIKVGRLMFSFSS
jgi:hypothetical protein